MKSGLERGLKRRKMKRDKSQRNWGYNPFFFIVICFLFYQSHFIYNYYYAAQYISAPYALVKLIGKYYYSSSYSFSDFTINHKKMTDGSNFDLLALDCFSTRNLKIYFCRFRNWAYRKNYCYFK